LPAAALLWQAGVFYFLFFIFDLQGWLNLDIGICLIVTFILSWLLVI
jgi:hypothetical protein